MPPFGEAVRPHRAVLFSGLAEDEVEVTKQSFDKDHRFQIKWFNVFLQIYMHINALYGVYLMFSSAKWATILFAFFLHHMGAIGICAGAHRLYSHKAFKATRPLQCLIVLMQTLAFQGTVFSWAQDHRVHHKFVDTDGDPHNSTRGFFFSHIGWLMCKKHPMVIAGGKKVDLSDLTKDPIVEFQRKYYWYIMPVVCFLLPTATPIYYWNETFNNAYYVNWSRYIFTLHGVCLINSIAHAWGSKPYDKTISPTESLIVTLGTSGEGHHNFHHSFPWDYRQYELSGDFLNFSTAFINFFAWLGWAYDLKVVSDDVVKARGVRLGDRSHPVWGYEDPDMRDGDAAVVLKKFTSANEWRICRRVQRVDFSPS